MNRAISKYWITAVMIGLVIVFAFLYVQQGWKTTGDPKLRLATLEGDPKAVTDLSVWGTYRYSRDFNNRVQLNEHGIVHEKEPSLYEQTFEPWISAKDAQKMFDGYMDFFRGKKNYGTFYSDNDALAYVNTELINSNWILQLSVLDKNTKRQSDFEVAYPDSNTNYYWSTEAVQRTEDGQIVVFSSHRSYDNNKGTGYDQELVRLQIDVERKAIASKTTVVAGKEEDHRQVGLLRNSTVYQPLPYMLISAPANGKLGYYSYQTSTGKLAPIEISGGQQDTVTLLDVEGPRLDYAYTDGTQIHLQSYDMATGQPSTDELVIDTSQWNAEFTRAIAANEQAVSIIYENKQTDERVAGVAIVDRQTGKVIYRGEVQADGTEQERLKALSKFEMISGLALYG